MSCFDVVELCVGASKVGFTVCACVLVFASGWKNQIIRVEPKEHDAVIVISR